MKGGDPRYWWRGWISLEPETVSEQLGDIYAKVFPLEKGDSVLKERRTYIHVHLKVDLNHS